MSSNLFLEHKYGIPQASLGPPVHRLMRTIAGLLMICALMLACSIGKGTYEHVYYRQAQVTPDGKMIVALRENYRYYRKPASIPGDPDKLTFKSRNFGLFIYRPAEESQSVIPMLLDSADVEGSLESVRDFGALAVVGDSVYLVKFDSGEIQSIPALACSKQAARDYILLSQTEILFSEAADSRTTVKHLDFPAGAHKDILIVNGEYRLATGGHFAQRTTLLWNQSTGMIRLHIDEQEPGDTLKIADTFKTCAFGDSGYAVYTHWSERADSVINNFYIVKVGQWNSQPNVPSLTFGVWEGWVESISVDSAGSCLVYTTPPSYPGFNTDGENKVYLADLQSATSRAIAGDTVDRVSE